VFSGGTASNTTIAGGKLELFGTASGAITFAASTSGTLEVDITTMPGATISAFAPHDKIDLVVISGGSGSAGTWSLTSGNVLQVTEGGSTYNLQLDPAQSFVGRTFTLAGDGLFGTAVTLTGPKSTLPVSIGGAATISHSFLWSFDTDKTTGAYGSAADVTYTVTAPIHGTILVNGAVATSFTQADIDNGLVQYQNNGDGATSDGFTFTVSDQAGNNITEPYSIAIVNTTAPVIDANATVSAPIGTAAIIWTNALCTVALGSDPAQMIYTVLTAPAHGALLVSGTPATSFTQAHIDDGLLHYQAIGDGTNSDSFTFQDAAGDRTPVATFNIAILGGPLGPGTAGQTPTFNDGPNTPNLALLSQYAAAGFPTAPDQGGAPMVTYAAAQGSRSAPTLLTTPQH
jgi:hypothetical protein